MLNNKRRIRDGCWKRGILWGRGGEWFLGRHRNTQQHFKDAPAPTKQPHQDGVEMLALSMGQLIPNWGKFPMVGAPSSASATSVGTESATDGATGMAAAASPDVSTGKPDREKTSEKTGKTMAPSMETEDAPNAKRQDSNRHVGKTDRLGDFPEREPPGQKRASKNNGGKPVILLNRQMAHEEKMAHWDRVSHKASGMVQSDEASDVDVCAGDRMRR